MSGPSGAIGMLQLDIPPNNTPGSINSPATYPFPIICRRVPGAVVSNTAYGQGDDHMASAWVETARMLVAEGAVAISSNCGFSIKYQTAIAQTVPVPVATSSLLLLPFLLSITDGRVAVITFDSRPLTPGLLLLSGVKSLDRVIVAGIENSETWEAMSRPENDYTIPQLANDLIASISRLRLRQPDIKVILFECAAFPLAAKQVREHTGLPVFDAVTNAKLLMSGITSGG